MDDLKQLKEQYKEELLNKYFLFGFNIPKIKNAVVISHAWINSEKFSIPTNSSGYKVEKSGCFLCYIINWRKSKNGWTVPYKVANS